MRALRLPTKGSSRPAGAWGHWHSPTGIGRRSPRPICRSPPASLVSFTSLCARGSDMVMAMVLQDFAQDLCLLHSAPKLSKLGYFRAPHHLFGLPYFIGQETNPIEICEPLRAREETRFCPDRDGSSHCATRGRGFLPPPRGHPPANERCLNTTPGRCRGNECMIPTKATAPPNKYLSGNSCLFAQKGQVLFPPQHGRCGHNAS